MTQTQEANQMNCYDCKKDTFVSFQNDEYEDVYLCKDCFAKETDKQDNEVKECYDQNKTSVHLCQLCGLEEPMYPQHWDSADDCGIYCADCFWEKDSERKRARRAWLYANPEALQAYREHVCQVLGLSPVQPSPQTEQLNKIEAKSTGDFITSSQPHQKHNDISR